MQLCDDSDQKNVAQLENFNNPASKQKTIFPLTSLHLQTKSSAYFLIGLSSILFTLVACSNTNDKQQSISQKGKADTSAIFILPYEDFDSSLLLSVKESIAKFYHLPVQVLSKTTLPKQAWQPDRKRYSADSLLTFQRILAKQHKGIVVGLTDKDIAASRGNIKSWGVFGLGFCPGKSCIISTKRLYKAGSGQQLVIQRLLKVVLHELGHNLGLPHCRSQQRCLMNDAKGKLKNVDEELMELCPHCRQQLNTSQKSVK